MKATLSVCQRPCLTIRENIPRIWQRESVTATTAGPLFLVWALLIIAVVLLLPLPALGQDHGSGHGGSGGGGGGCGDVFGDLIHILRHADTGQPIFAKRWVEMPKELPGYGWGYCPIAVSDYLVVTDPLDAEYGNYMLDEDLKPIEGQTELPFAPYSCDVHPLFTEMMVDVDYFGRLNGGRTKERNNRMHFDEVISSINQAGQLNLDPTGRLMMGYDCKLLDDPGTCLWATIDSPMESMSLYTRLMKYGHFAAHPNEVDTWAHGDPALGIQFHPALTEEDWAKFIAADLTHLLPKEDTEACWKYDQHEDFTDDNVNGTWDSGEWYFDENENGLWDAFTFTCAGPTSLKNADFVSSSVYLGAAAPKTGIITADLVQYFNRFLKITQNTPNTASTPDTLPGLYWDCFAGPDPWDEHEEPPPGYDLSVDLAYGDCGSKPEIVDPLNTHNYAMFTNLHEVYMDFGKSKYQRTVRVGNSNADLILESSSDINTWNINYGKSLLEWAAEVNPEVAAIKDIHNYVRAATDAVRMIEYFHNYAIPDDLYCIHMPETYCQ